jgi:tRNA(Ile)-lysidine synthase
MRGFERELVAEWRRLKLPFEGTAIVVATSGGADSVSLALALGELRNAGKLGLRFVLAHFNHRLRGAESDADEDFVRHLAERHEMELSVGKAGRLGAGNLEQVAREARYGFLRDVAETVKAPVVVTGHTLDDQAETFLLNLLRGSGPRGLAGMPSVREIGSTVGLDVFPRQTLADTGGPVYLARPLLSWGRRSETEAYCRELGEGFRYDSMNEDLAFTRVKIRKLLLPMLQEFNPKAVETLARTADLMRLEVSVEGTDPAEPDWEAETLAVATLGSVPRSRLLTGVRAWLGVRRGSVRGLAHHHFEAVADLALSQKSGRTVELPGGSKVLKSKGVLSFRK